MRRCLLFESFFVLLLIFAGGAFGVEIDCEFGLETSAIGEFYSCKAKRLAITTNNEEVESITGDHLSGMTDIEVEMLHVDDQTFNFFPSGIENSFPNLKVLKIVSSGLKSLNQDNLRWLSDLLYIDISDNDIESLDGDLFAFNEKLKHISIDSNKIKTIGANIFEPLHELESVSLKSNDCIDESWSKPEEIASAKKKLEEKCSNKSIFESIKNIWSSVPSVEQHLQSSKDLSQNTIKKIFESIDLDDSDSDYEVDTTKVTKLTKITRVSPSKSPDFDDSESTNEIIEEVSCDLSNAYWKYSVSDLYTCTIQNQPIEHSRFKIEISKDDGEKVRGLLIDDNKKVKFLPMNLAEAFPNLEELSIKNSFIESIPGEAFKGLGKLKRLSITNNDLTVLEKSNFAELTELEELDLSEGNIRFIEEDAFSDLHHLKAIFLGGNKLRFIQPKTFDGLTDLRNISLELNHLTDLDDDVFSSNTKLNNVWLNGNKINVVSPSVFIGLTDLTYVDMQGNECIDGVYYPSTFEEMKNIMTESCGSSYVIRRTFKKHRVYTEDDESHGKVRNEYNNEELMSIVQDVEVIESEEGEPEVKTIATEVKNVIKINPADKTVACDISDVYWSFSKENLKTCVIQDQVIDAKAFVITKIPDSDEVKGLNMAFNKMIKYLPENTATIFPNLEEFSAQNSSLVLLSRKNFEGLDDLKSLNLANNNIKFIETDTFDDLKNLEELDLSSNNMEYIDENLFSKLKSLKTLRLGGNKLHFVHPKLFKNLRNLQNVSISSNHLTTLDGNLFKANQKLENVWLQGNKIKSLSQNMFQSAKELDYVDLRDNKCIDSVYEKSAFEVMKTEISKKCGDGYVLKRGSKSTKTTKKSETKKKKPEPEAEIKEVGCEYDDVYWPSLNKTLFTCVVSSDQIIDEPGYTISVNSNPFALPLIDGDTVQALSFASNKNIKFLPENIGEAFPNLLVMSAPGNEINSIKKGNLKNLKKLQLLDLAQNNIKSIHQNAFEDLTSLEEINLDDNEFEYIEETTFTHTKRLRKMKMSGNKLKTINPDMFDGLTELIDVTVEVLDPSDLSEDLFKTNSKLKDIKVNGKAVGLDLQPVDLFHVIDDEVKTTPEPMTTENVTEKIEDDQQEDFESKEVACEINEIYSDLEESTVFTCKINPDEIIGDASYTIKPSPDLEKVQKFSIEGNKNIKTLPENLSQVFPNLKEIAVTNSGLSGVSKKNLEGLKQLKRLFLAKNNILHIESDTFDDLDKLEHLDLSENNMEFIEESLLHKLKNLKVLHLLSNKLHYLHPKTFRYLENIEYITLDSNLLSVNNPKLKKFKINEDVIKDEPLEEIEVMTTPVQADDEVEVYETTSTTTSRPSTTESMFETSETPATMKSTSEVTCTLGYANWPKTNSTLITCELKNQAIDDPETVIKLTPYSPYVHGLKIEDNKNAKYLPKNIAESFPNLIELSAKNLSLETIFKDDLNDLKNLKTLNLSENNIETIEPETFNDLWSLEDLDLSNNEIESIDEDDFPNLTKLKTLNLNGNKIHFIHPKTFENLKQLTNLNIEGNRLPETKKQELYKIIKENLKAESTTEKHRYAVEVTPETETQLVGEEIQCSFGDTYWYFTDSYLFSCYIKDSIEDPRVTIQSSQRNARARGLSFIDNKKIKFLPQDLARSLPNLIGISGFNSSIESISPQNFKDLRHLKYLNLANNKINSIPYGTFNDLTSLEDLDLSNNQIEYLDESTFENLGSLTSLSLGGNNIRQLPGRLFEYLPNLRNLSIENNMIANIDPGVFRNNKNLENVWLNGNKIRTLSPSTFDELQKLEYVDLQGNTCIDRYFDESNLEEMKSLIRSCSPQYEQTQSITFRPDTKPSIPRKPQETTRPKQILCNFEYADWPDTENSLYTCIIADGTILPHDTIRPSPYSMYVEALRFDNKHVQNLPKDISETFPNLIRISAKNSSLNLVQPLDGLTKLKSLDLSDNNLESIDPESLTDLPSLEELNLNHNRIRNLDGNALPRSVKTLNLGDNQLYSINNDFFKNLPELTTLNIERNNIQEIDGDAFKNNKLLEKISLGGNRIAVLSAKTFENLPNLQSIDLEENACVSGIYDPMSFKALTYEILRSCRQPAINLDETDGTDQQYYYRIPINRDYEDNTQARVDPHVDIDVVNLSYRKLSCRFVETFSPFLNSHVYTCKVERQPVDTTSYTFEEVPENSRVKRLAFASNENNHFLPDDIGRTFPNLVEVVMSDSSVKTLRPENFKDMRHVKSLDLSRNNLKIIEPETFDELTSLEELNLSQNNLKFIDELNLPSLKALNLNGNKISFLEPETFSKLSDLVRFNASNNKLSDIDIELFKLNPNVENIDLSFNQIKSIHPDAFEGLRHLKIVDLKENLCLNQTFSPNTLKALRRTLHRHCQPYDGLKRSFSLCRHEIELCKRNSSSTPRLENIKKDNERLRAFMARAEIKIRRMNNQQKRLRNALNYEKNLVRNFKQRVHLMENKQDKSICPSAEEAQSSLIDLMCDFEESSNEITKDYTCKVEKLHVGNDNSTIGNIKGDHSRGKRDVDVTSLAVADQSMKYLPSGLYKFFPRLEKLTIHNSKLSKLSQTPLTGLLELNELVITGNDIEEIELGSFDKIYQLRVLDLSRNHIHKLPTKVFENLHNLKILNLNNNAIQSLSYDMIPDQSKIKVFSVSTNILELIDPRIFSRLPDAHTIDLTRNRCVKNIFSRDTGDDHNTKLSLIAEVAMKCLGDKNGFCNVK